jgi:tRNA G18 (ribose-2'-O)-methylase SpoU
VGGIIRSAECFGVEELYFCGYTAIPTNQKVSNTSLGCEKFIKWQYCEETIFAINSVRNKGYEVLALEISEKSTSLFEYNFNEIVAIIIGNDALGISDETMSNCDEVIKIPLLGKKQSLNVSVACSIACYEYLKQREYARTSRS